MFRRHMSRVSGPTILSVDKLLSFVNQESRLK